MAAMALAMLTDASDMLKANASASLFLAWQCVVEPRLAWLCRAQKILAVRQGYKRFAYICNAPEGCFNSLTELDERPDNHEYFYKFGAFKLLIISRLFNYFRLKSLHITTLYSALFYRQKAIARTMNI